MRLRGPGLMQCKQLYNFPGLMSAPAEPSGDGVKSPNGRRNPCVTEAHQRQASTVPLDWHEVYYTNCPSIPEWLIWAPTANLPLTESPAKNRRSVRSHFETPAALRDDRWPRPSREIRRYLKSALGCLPCSFTRPPGCAWTRYLKWCLRRSGCEASYLDLRLSSSRCRFWFSLPAQNLTWGTCLPRKNPS